MFEASKIPISTNKLGMVIGVCNLKYMRGIGRRMAVQGLLGKNTRPNLKNSLKQKV
jgi:hypothetical protein